MLCLSIRQPWATLIVTGQKNIEIRHWQPSLKHVGQRILIHTGKKKAEPPAHVENMAAFYNQPLGAIVGSAVLDGIVRYEKYTDFIVDEELHLNPACYWDGECYGFIFSEVKRFHSPVPYAGKLNLFEVKINEASIPGCYVPAAQRRL